MQRLLEEQQAREAKDRMRKRLRQRPGSAGIASAVADAMAQLRAESAGDGEMISSLDRIQAVLEGRPDTEPAKDPRSANTTADSEPATGQRL